MSALAKFFVVFNLVLSLFFFGASATLYLTRYNPDRPDSGWKLLQERQSGKWSKGYSHHVRPID